MISEVTFAKKHTSFWNALLPNANNFIRIINGSLVEDIYKPLALQERKENIVFVNELAFRLYSMLVKGQITIARIRSKELDTHKSYIEAFQETQVFLSRFKYSINFNTPLSNDEVNFVREITANIYHQYLAVIGSMETSPLFKGCGFINPANGDLYTANKLIEIKSGGRKFSIYDFRQILIYCTLNFYSPQKRLIDEVELFNPRMGIIYTTTVNALCKDLSSLQPQELFFEIKEAITDISFIDTDFT
ncbi:hypothetical protein OZ680_002666 [Yersinia enterocolitica]